MRIQNVIHIPILIICLGLLPRAHAVSPPPDGGYANFTTAEGQNALLHLSSGAANTGVGWYSLFGDTTGSFNTGVGAGTLVLNTGDENTAIGTAALLLNTASGNTALGSRALLNNTTGGALGNINGFDVGPNVAVGSQALESNTVASANTAVGYQALQSFTTGPTTAEQVGLCTAVGFQALTNATGDGIFNSGFGYQALFNNATGFSNTAVGFEALDDNTTGSNNTAVGVLAGSNITGDGNVCIGSSVNGDPGASNTTWIKNVYDSVANGRAVYVNFDNKIGTLSSSRRYKDQIKPMNKASEALLWLKPVTFRYKKEVDRTQSLSFGLIAEEVAEIDPDLVTLDREGKPETVRYEAVNAMLLNEFLKEHRKVQELEAAVSQQRKDFEAGMAQQQKETEALVARLNEQEARIQKVSGQVEMRNYGSQMLVENR